MFQPKFVYKKLVAFISVLLVAEILFDPISIVGNFIEKNKIQRELAKAQQLWSSNGSDNYKIKIRGSEPMVCIYDAILTVHQGKLVSVETREPFNEKAEYKMIDKQEWGAFPHCEYGKFTISKIFTDVSNALDNTNSLREKPKVTFDSINGYVTYYGINYHGYGLFTFVLVSDCCSWYEFSDYEPIK